MRSVDRLSQRLGRSPTIPELVEDTGISFEAVLEALEAGRAYAPASLDADGPEDDGDRTATLLESLGREDESFQRLEDRTTLSWAIGQLPDREREVVSMRFFERLSQGEVARLLGISQMHVSRLQRAALERLRALIASGPGSLSS
jgi:RNA polymerase sigma-B factor